MTPDELIAELRALVDAGDLARVRARVARLDAAMVRGVVVVLLAIDASYRAAAALGDEEDTEPSASVDPDRWAAGLDDAARVRAALSSIDDAEDLFRAVYRALSEDEVRLVVFEEGFRRIIEERWRGA